MREGVCERIETMIEGEMEATLLRPPYGRRPQNAAAGGPATVATATALACAR